MRIKDVVNQLQVVLPKFTDYFSDIISISSITASGGVATIVAPNHGQLTGNAVTIKGITQKTMIDEVAKDGLVFTFGLASKHDLTYGYPGYESVILGGFTDTNWNESFTLISVPTRQTFVVQSINSLPILNGSEYLAENRIDGINGRHSVTVIDENTLTISGDFLDGDYDSTTGSIKSAVRIAGSINIERTIEEYTKKGDGEIWAFVSMNNAKVSKDRNAYNDADATFLSGEDPRLRIVDGFSVFLVGSTINEIAGINMLDIFRHELLGPILKSLSGVEFDSGLEKNDVFKSVLTRHNYVFYNRAILVYQYDFQFVYDITLDDQADEADTRAFSEINYRQLYNSDTEELTFDKILPNEG